MLGVPKLIRQYAHWKYYLLISHDFALLCVSDPCDVEVISYGYSDTMVNSSGYARVGGVYYNIFSYRGITIGKLGWNDRVRVLVDLDTYDTHIPDRVKALRNWLNDTVNGDIIVAFTTGDASKNLEQVVDLFGEMGVNVTEIGFHWRMAFVAYVGFPEYADVIIEPPGDQQTILCAQIPGE